MSDLNFSEIGRKIQGLISANGTQDSPKDEELEKQKNESETLFDYNISDKNINADDLYNGMVSFSNKQEPVSDVETKKNLKSKAANKASNGEKTVDFSNGKKIELNDGETFKKNTNGTVQVTSADKKTVTEYDKNGVLKSITKTETAKDGTKTSTRTAYYDNGKPWTKTITSTFNNKTVGYSHTVYDRQENLSYERIKNEYENGKAGCDILKGYTKDGSINYEIKDSLLGDDYPRVVSYGSTSATIYFDNKGSKKIKITVGQNAVINSDGSVNVTSADGKTVTKYDKNGLKTSEAATRKVGSSKVSTVDTENFFDENGNVTKEVVTAYKDGGTVYTIENNSSPDTYPLVMPHGPHGVRIQFNANGAKLVLEKGQNAVINDDGTVKLTNADGSITKYDKDGNEIKDNVITFSNGTTLELKEGETFKTDYDNYGSVMVTSADGSLMTEYNKKGLTTRTTLVEILDDGGKKVTRTDYIVNNRLGTTKPGTVTEIGYTKEGYTSYLSQDYGTSFREWDYYDFDENGNPSRTSLIITDNQTDKTFEVYSELSSDSYPKISSVNRNSVEIQFSSDKNNKIIVNSETVIRADGIVEVFNSDGTITWYNKDGNEIKNDVISFSNDNILILAAGETFKQNADRSAEIISADGKTVTKYDKNGFKTSEVKTERFFDNEGNITKTEETTTSFEYMGNGENVAADVIEKTFDEVGDLTKSIEKIFVNDELLYEIEDYSGTSNYPKTDIRDSGFYGAILKFGSDTSKNISLKQGDRVLIGSDGTTIITDKSGKSNAYAKTGESFLDYVLNLKPTPSTKSAKGLKNEKCEYEEHILSNGTRKITKRFYNNDYLISEIVYEISEYEISEEISNFHILSTNKNRPGGNGQSDYEWLSEEGHTRDYTQDIYSRENDEHPRRIIKERVANYEKPSVKHLKDRNGRYNGIHEITEPQCINLITIFYDYNNDGDQRVFQTEKYSESSPGKLYYYGDEMYPYRNNTERIQEAGYKTTTTRYQYLNNWEENPPYIETEFCGSSKQKDFELYQFYVQPINGGRNESRDCLGVYLYQNTDEGWKCTSPISANSDGVISDAYTRGLKVDEISIGDKYVEAIVKGYIQQPPTNYLQLGGNSNYNLEQRINNWPSYLYVDTKKGDLSYPAWLTGDIDSVAAKLFADEFFSVGDILMKYWEQHPDKVNLSVDLSMLSGKVIVADGRGPYKVIDVDITKGEFTVRSLNYIANNAEYTFSLSEEQKRGHFLYVNEIPLGLAKILYPLADI